MSESFRYSSGGEDAQRNLAVTPDGREYSASGFDHVKHDRWVRAGHCPVVSISKMWCGRASGHQGRHGSPRVPAPGTEGPQYADWEA
jgi:hypothetical protein